MLPKRHRHYVLGPLSRVGSLYKGNSTSFEEPAGFPFDTGAVLLCANLNAKCADSQGKTKNKARNKFGGGLSVFPETLHPKGKEFGKLLTLLWVADHSVKDSSSWGCKASVCLSRKGTSGTALCPSLYPQWLSIQIQGQGQLSILQSVNHDNTPQKFQLALHDSCPFHVDIELLLFTKFFFFKINMASAKHTNTHWTPLPYPSLSSPPKFLKTALYLLSLHLQLLLTPQITAIWVLSFTPIHDPHLAKVISNCHVFEAFLFVYYLFFQIMSTFRIGVILHSSLCSWHHGAHDLLD